MDQWFGNLLGPLLGNDEGPTDGLSLCYAESMTVDQKESLTERGRTRRLAASRETMMEAGWAARTGRRWELPKAYDWELR